MGSHVHVIFVDMYRDTREDDSQAFCKLRQMAQEDEQRGEDDDVDRKAVFGLGKESIHAFVVLYRSMVVNGLYLEHELCEPVSCCDEPGINQSNIRFGTIHLGLNTNVQAVEEVCIGIIDVIPPHDDEVAMLGNGHADKLAHWTKAECHDFVVVNARKNFPRENWIRFASTLSARYN